MQFLVLGLDGTDEEALERRLKVRPAHIALGEEHMEEGSFWFGGAIMNEARDKMIGSALIMDFPSRNELDEWLEIEPYITGDVWRDVNIYNLAVPDPWEFTKPKEFYEARNGEQFFVLGIDPKDEGALERRLNVRPKHVEGVYKLRDQGDYWFGGPLFDESRELMNGSALFMDLPSRKELDQWLENEPYVLNDIWENLTIFNLSVRNPWEFNKSKEFYEERIG